MKLSKISLIIAHMLLGFIIYEFSFISTYVGIGLILFGTYCILSRPDPLERYPVFFCSYIVGIEVLLRMAGANLFWEFGKYAVIYFLLLGILRQRNKFQLYSPILYYFLLLLPAIIFVPITPFNIWRQDVAFNLSGPATLALCSIYFYNRKIYLYDFEKILFFMILPIFSMAVYNIFSMPDLATYNFMPYSNFHTSGGYGPNQVSTVFGIGIASILVAQVLKINLFGSTFVNLLILSVFTGFGLITFSRGGILAAVIAFSVSISYYLLHDQKKIYIISKGIILLIVTIISWYTIVSITDGVITERYGFGKSLYGEKFIMDLTGRALIYEIDLNIFSDKFFTGSGPGQAKELRHQYGYTGQVTAHTEFSRMLAEHGILGLLSLLILIIITGHIFVKSDTRNSKFIKLCFGLIALLSMGHSAMRLAMPEFIYGLIFMTLNDDSQINNNQIV